MELDLRDSIKSLCAKVEKNKTMLKETISKLETKLVRSSQLYDEAVKMQEQVNSNKEALQSLKLRIEV